MELLVGFKRSVRKISVLQIFVLRPTKKPISCSKPLILSIIDTNFTESKKWKSWFFMKHPLQGVFFTGRFTFIGTGKSRVFFYNDSTFKQQRIGLWEWILMKYEFSTMFSDYIWICFNNHISMHFLTSDVILSHQMSEMILISNKTTFWIIQFLGK